ncbi:MAG: prepilin-type N-terminal cleavage/methylation domain-containing protein [Candidatus Saccharibacteria bacterium]
MKNNQEGFSAIELVVIVVVIALLAGLGFMFFQRKNKSTSSTNSTASTTVKSQFAAPIAAGTTASIDSLVSKDASSESTIDQKHTASEGTAAQSTSSAAANIGGAYNESSL